MSKYFWILFLIFCLPCAADAAGTAVAAENVTGKNAEAKWNDLTIWSDLPPLYNRVPLPENLDSRRILFVWNGKHNSDLFLQHFSELIDAGFPNAIIVPFFEQKDQARVPADMADAESLAEKIMTEKPDLVVASTGDCRSCAAWMAILQIIIEKKGTPTISIVTEPFYKTFFNVCQNMRMEFLTCLAVPHPVAIISPAKVRTKAEMAYTQFKELFRPIVKDAAKNTD